MANRTEPAPCQQRLDRIAANALQAASDPAPEHGRDVARRMSIAVLPTAAAALALPVVESASASTILLSLLPAVIFALVSFGPARGSRALAAVRR